MNVWLFVNSFFGAVSFMVGWHFLFERKDKLVAGANFLAAAINIIAVILNVMHN